MLGAINGVSMQRTSTSDPDDSEPELDCWACGDTTYREQTPRLVVDGDDQPRPVLCLTCNAYITTNAGHVDSDQCGICLRDDAVDAELLLDDESLSVCADCRRGLLDRPLGAAPRLADRE